MVCPPDAFISGYPASVIAQGESLAEGIDFLGKRVSHDELARKVREILDRT